MKCACIVLQKRIGAENQALYSVLKTLGVNGFPMQELRMLPQNDEQCVCSAIKGLKGETDYLFLLCDKTALPIAKRYLTGIYEESALRGDFGGACIYEENKNCLFLFSADETDTGKGYVLNACIPFLQKKNRMRYEKLVVRTIGASAERIEALLAETRRLGGDFLQCYHVQKYAEDVIEISYGENAPKMLLDDVMRLLVDGLGDTVYALNDVSVEEQLVTLLKLRRRKISVAESFTGGGIAKRITSVSGASEVYFEGLNTYDERSKIKRLGVSEYTLNMSGAVSEQTAYEMAYGLLKTGDCDIAIATTGLAGPKTDRSMLPVGLCYLAVGFEDRVYVYKYKFDGNREEITQTAINYALYLAYKQLKSV